MIVTRALIPDVLRIEPQRFEDERGWFNEAFRASAYAAWGIPASFPQDSVSRSRRGVLRGLHFQHPAAQGKLVSCLEGEVLDVAVDLRLGSPTFGRHVATRLSSANGIQKWIPEGFAHGFLVLSNWALFHYKCTREYDPGGQFSIRWDDPELGIEWPIASPAVSIRDATAQSFSDTVTALEA